MFREMNEKTDELWLDWLDFVTHEDRAAWAALEAPTHLFLCDKCDLHGSPAYPAAYVSTETNEAWCKDCIESIYYYCEALEKNADK